MEETIWFTDYSTEKNVPMSPELGPSTTAAITEVARVVKGVPSA
jgi:hypothetical protein